MNKFFTLMLFVMWIVTVKAYDISATWAAAGCAIGVVLLVWYASILRGDHA